jgi:hypothetical protein
VRRLESIAIKIRMTGYGLAYVSLEGRAPSRLGLVPGIERKLDAEGITG